MGLIDSGYRPDMFLLLMLIDGEPHFIGVRTKEDVDSKIKSAKPGEAALVEYMTAASFGNTRFSTMADAIKSRAGWMEEIGIQPASIPKGLHPTLAAVWWNAPRAENFPDFEVK